MNNTFTFILGVVVGTIIGGLVTLLFAPQSGEELRTRLQQEALAERQRMQSRYDHRKNDLKDRVDLAYSDLRSPQEQSGTTGEQSSETAQ